MQSVDLPIRNDHQEGAIPGIASTPSQPDSEDIKSEKPYEKGENHAKIDQWIAKISTSRAAEFLRDKPRVGVLPSQASLLEFTIEPELYGSMKHFCQQREFTELAVLFASFRMAHFRLSGVTDALIGVVTDGSAQPGLWGEYLGDLRGIETNIHDESFEDVIRQVSEHLAPSQENQTVPLREFVGRVETAKPFEGPPLPVLFGFCSTQQDRTTIPEEEHSSKASIFDLEFHALQEADRLRVKILYSNQIYHVETVRSIANTFQRVIEYGIQLPTTPVAVLPLLTDTDFSALDTMGLIQIERTNYPRNDSIIDVFRQQVTTYASRVAVRDSNTELTYTQLDDLSDSIARSLAKRAFPAETLIGVFADRTCHTIAMFLGILKANLAYLPFDIRSPAARLELILSSIPGPKVVLIGDGIEPPVLQCEDVEFVPFQDTINDGVHESQVANGTIQLSTPSPESLAYVIFTSGSTGRPKGVMMEHRGVVRLVKESNIAQELPDDITMSHLTNVSFDASVWEIYASLLNGGTLVCISTETVLDTQALTNIFTSEKIQTAFLTPGLLKQYIIDCPTLVSQLAMLCVAGDRFDMRDLPAIRDIVTGTVMNAYGPTENSVFSTLYMVSKAEPYQNGVPIGYATSNSGAYVMDDQQRLVPLGVVGEIVVTGDGLARGYSDPNLDINRFMPVEIGTERVRGYRTGDIGRHRPVDGKLESFGRRDGQVKIRGHRVEIGEIEHTMSNHSYVNDAAVILNKYGDSGVRLVGFVARCPDEKLNNDANSGGDEQLRDKLYESLKGRLPSYMIPDEINILDKIPMTLNGKVDRRTLEQMVQSRGPRQNGPQRQIRPPTTEVELQIHKIWSECLKISTDSFGLDESFFELGGNSLDAMRVAGSARNAGIQLTVRDILRHKSIGNLISHEAFELKETATKFEEVNLVDPATKKAILEEIQHRGIDIDSNSVENIFPTSNTQDEFFYRPGVWREFYEYFYMDLGYDDLDLQSFERNSALTLERYPVLRACFVENIMGRNWQLVLHQLESPIRVEDVDQDLDEFFQAFALKDVANVSEHQPPTAIFLFRHKTQGARLSIRMQHAQYDALSLQIIFKSLVGGNQYLPPPSETPTFYHYMSYASQKRPEAISYWKKMLQGASSITAIQPKLRPQHCSTPKPVEGNAQTKLPVLPDNSIMLSSITNAAWAVYLALFIGVDDVVFWESVAGRNSAIRGIEHIAGPCISVIPIRVILSSIQTPRQLLQGVQEQLIECGETDSLAKEIVSECTDWPYGLFDMMLQHQSYGWYPTVDCFGAKREIRFDLNPYLSEPFPWLSTYAENGRLQVRVFGSTSQLTEEAANHLVHDVCNIVDIITENLDVPFQECMSRIKLTS